MRVYLLGTALAAVWLTLSRLHRLHSSDSLIFSLASLYEWTPFFWDQDRVGMLLPLLATPVRHPLLNELVITGLMSFCGLLAPLLLAQLVCPQPGAYAAVTLGNALLIAFGPVVLQENYLTTCVYPLALCLGVPAVGLLDRPGVGRTVAAGLLLLLAHWVYLGLALFIAPLAVGLWLVEPTRNRFWAAVRSLAVITAAFGLMLVAAGAWRHFHPEVPSTPSSGLPVSDWPANWLAFLTTLAGYDGFAGWAVAVVVTVLVGLAVPAGRSVRLALGFCPLVAATVAELLVIGTRAWPAMNYNHPRYLLAGVSAVTVVLLVAAWGPVFQTRFRQAAAAAVTFALLAVAIGWRFGLPSVANAREELTTAFGTDVDDLIGAEADAVGGEYLATWPAAWCVNLARYEQGLPTPVAGVSSKAGPWARRWQSGGLRDGFRLAAPFDQEDATRKWITHYRLTITDGPARHGRLIVFTVRPVGG